MGKKKPKVEVTEYRMSDHFGISIGPVDALKAIIVKEKPAWTGTQFEQGTISINLPDLFGGIKKEGGVAGEVTFLPGNSDQVLPDVLAQKLGRPNGASCPGFRGIASLFFHGFSGLGGFYWTANTPYLPGVWTTVKRIFKRSDGTEQWYPGKAEVMSSEPVIGTVELSWSQNTFVQPGGNDEARMGIGFLDVDGALIGSVAWSSYAQPTTWTSRSVSAVAPAGARRVRIYMGMQRLAGSYCDGYIDGISATLDGISLSLDNPSAESGNTTGWTNEVGAIDWALGGAPSTGGTFPPAADGSYYFSGGFSATAIAYQDVNAGTGDMNPAHIIHEALTDTVWGMGTPATALDDAAFRAAADTLFAENFGMSLLWTRQSKIEDFVQEILDHIQGVLYVDPSTGLLTLTLVRGDYDPDTLDELTPDNCDVSSFSRKLWGDIVNEIIVTWTNPVNEQEETITVQDDASIATQGGIISDSRNYYGVRNRTLAMDLAMRDLRSAGQPLASATVEVDRSFWNKRPASVVKLTWPEYGLSELVMRVQSVDYGKPGDMTIKIELMEDVFGLDIGSYDAPPGTLWEDTSGPPEELSEIEILTVPLYFAANSTVAAFVDSPEYPEVLAGVLGTTDNTDIFEAELWDEVTLANGSLEWQSISTLNIIGRGELVDALPLEAATAGVTFQNITGQTRPAVAGFIIIGASGESGNEIAMVDTAGGDFDLIRGVLDTVPRAWPAGTKCWFVNAETLWEDTLVRSSGETVDYKVLTRSSLALLDLSAAALQSNTLTDRPWLPNRPANVIAHGEDFSTQDAPIEAVDRADPWITVTWANRNRLEEDSIVMGWTDATMTPETGQTTTIEVRAMDGTLLITHDGLTGTSFDVPNSSFGAEAFVELRVYSERSDTDGDFSSLQYFSHWVHVDGSVRISEASDWRITESGDVRVMED